MTEIDLDALLDASVKHNGPTCRVAELDGTARAVLERGIERGIAASAIARALGTLGVEISLSTVQRHKLGGCRTCRKT